MKELHKKLTEEHQWYAKWHEHPAHHHVHVGVLVIAILAAVSGLINYSNTVASQPTSLPPVVVENQNFVETNNRLLSLSHRYQNAKTIEAKKALLAQLIDLATQRKADLLTVMKKNPKEFNQLAFPGAVRKNLPSEILFLIEAPITVEGKFSVRHQDDFVNPANSIWDYTVKTKEGKIYHLNSANDISASPDSTVKVSGIVLDDQIIFGASGTTTNDLQTIAQAPVVKSPLGEQRTAVIIWTTSTSTTYTADQMRNLFFAEPNVNPKSVNSYFKEGSFGQTRFTGDVFGPYTSISSSLDCYGSLPTTLNQKVFDSTGVDVTQYPRIVYVGGNCGNAAFYNGYAHITSSDSNNLLGFAYHELGHVLSINHANSLRCGTKQIDIFSNCSNIEYGDHYTSMGANVSGGGQAPFQFNAPHKAMLSWLPQSKIQYITTDGTYTVYASEKTQPGPQLLSIYKPDFNQYYDDGSIRAKGYLSIGFRQAYGLDATLPSNVINGVTIHLHNFGFERALATFNMRTNMLDVTPGDDNNLHNKAVLDGMTFTDNVNGTSITQLSHTADSATVRVKFFTTTPCTRGQSIVTNLSGTDIGIVAGETRAISVNVYNADNDSCGSSNFTLSANVPTGWTVVPTTVSVAPSGSTTGTIYVTPPVDTTPARYQITYKTSDASITEHNAVSTVNYISVSSPTNTTDTTPPTVSLTSPSNGSTISGITTLSASASDNVGVTKVDFYQGSTLLGTDTSAPYSISWDTSSLANGTYTITAKAYDVAGNIGTSSAINVILDNGIVQPPVVDTTPPVVVISAPKDGSAITRTTTISASATDNLGSITKMEIYIDGVLLRQNTLSSSISYKWGTRKTSAGAHTIMIKAYDPAGNVGVSSVTVYK